MEEENILGEIHVTITDQNVIWDSEMSFQDVHFWLSFTTQLILKKFLENESEEE